MITELTAAPPEVLLEYARGEPDRRALSEYGQVILELKRKGFPLREIAEWLQSHGIEADHNAVYRVYTKGLSAHEIAELDQEMEEEER